MYACLKANNCISCFSQLRACLVMQIVACVASIVNVVCTLIKDSAPNYCWRSYETDFKYGEICHKIEVSKKCLLYKNIVIIFS